MTVAVSPGARAHVALLALLLAGPVLAQGQPPASSELPLWELGAVGFGVSQQAYPGASEQVRRALVLPVAIYRGKYLRADRDTVGVRVVNQERFELDVGFAGAFGSRASETEARRGMPELGTLIEFGPRLKWNLGAAPADGRLRAEVALRGVFDLSDSLRYKGLALEPRLVYERRGDAGWRYGANVGPLLGNARLADTFYGVAPAYALPDRSAYVAQSGLIAWRLGVSASRAITPDLQLFVFGRLDSVAGAANRASPLVQRTNGTSVGVGLSYTFARSSQRAND